MVREPHPARRGLPREQWSRSRVRARSSARSPGIAATPSAPGCAPMGRRGKDAGAATLGARGKERRKHLQSPPSGASAISALPNYGGCFDLPVSFPRNCTFEKPTRAPRCVLSGPGRLLFRRREVFIPGLFERQSDHPRLQTYPLQLCPLIYKIPHS